VCVIIYRILVHKLINVMVVKTVVASVSLGVFGGNAVYIITNVPKYELK